MCKSEDQGSANSHGAIGDDAVRTVNDGPAKHQEQHAETSPGNNAFDLVSAKPRRESDDADGQDNKEHLNMKMSLGELTQKRQHRDENRQGEAMQQAECGQRDCSIVQPAQIIRRIVIHRRLPLCCINENHQNKMIYHNNLRCKTLYRNGFYFLR